jgi:hypothetical protein
LAREISLLEYLPGVLREIKEFKALATSEDPEAVTLWEELENVLDDQFVSDATLNGVKRWESILSIKPLDSDTLDERKFRILLKLNEQLPYTYRNLESQLALLCGDDGYKLILDNDNYALTVRVSLTAKKKLTELGNLLDRIIPCNIVISLLLMYNQWLTAKTKTWGGAFTYTWGQIRSEVIT